MPPNLTLESRATHRKTPASAVGSGGERCGSTAGRGASCGGWQSFISRLLPAGASALTGDCVRSGIESIFFCFYYSLRAQGFALEAPVLLAAPVRTLVTLGRSSAPQRSNTRGDYERRVNVNGLRL